MSQSPTHVTKKTTAGATTFVISIDGPILASLVGATVLNREKPHRLSTSRKCFKIFLRSTSKGPRGDQAQHRGNAVKERTESRGPDLLLSLIY